VGTKFTQVLKSSSFGTQSGRNHRPRGLQLAPVVAPSGDIATFVGVLGTAPSAAGSNTLVIPITTSSSGNPNSKIVVVASIGGGTTVLSAVDSKSQGPYALDNATASTAMNTGQLSAEQTAQLVAWVDSVTVTFSATTGVRTGAVLEYEFIQNTPYIDNIASNKVASATNLSTSATTTMPNDMAFVVAVAGNTSPSLAGGFNIRATVVQGAQTMIVGDLLEAASGSTPTPVVSGTGAASLAICLTNFLSGA
jgi:hypothetical protein